jgi:hypothetical protein
MSNSILQVVDYEYDEETQTGTVTAIIDDFILQYPATYEQPAEYGAGLAKASFMLGDDAIPEDETKLELFFEDLYLEWQFVNDN